jgi:hypothetical protein
MVPSQPYTLGNYLAPKKQRTFHNLGSPATKRVQYLKACLQVHNKGTRVGICTDTNNAISKFLTLKTWYPSVPPPGISSTDDPAPISNKI